MSEAKDFSKRVSSKVEIAYPDFDALPERVRKKFEALPTKVNFFRMLGHSPGMFVEIIDLTNAIFKNLTLKDYHKELLVLLVAAHEQSDYEWEQHVSVGQAAGVRENQFIAIATNRLQDAEAFSEDERILLDFASTLLNKGKAPGVLFKCALDHFSVQEMADAMIVVGFYRMLAGFIRTFELAIDPQQDGGWVKGL